ncbi:prepilin peptidase [Butyrivibrio sp. JL13D10]|uniref:prepilin peptidase n=1 Tax=Butyrivibrio sp. JL13D10 TaxID=3236815 RepID=UPI0038B5DE64
MVTRIIAGAGFAVAWSLFCAFLADYELKKMFKKMKADTKDTEESSENSDDSESVDSANAELVDKSFTNKQKYIFGAVITVLNIMLSVVLMFVYKETPIIEFIMRLGLVGIVEVAAITDKKYNLIPNDLIKVGLVLRAIALIGEISVFKSDVVSILISDAVGILTVVVIVLLCLLFMKGSVGMGDLKLMMLMALFQGIDGFTASGMLSLMVAFFAGVYYLVSKKKSRKDAMAFAPFLAVGTYLGIFLTGL